MKIKKDHIKLVLIFIFLAFLTYKTFDFSGVIGYRETWSICLDYMAQGVLWAGQPHCEGAILPFYVLYALDTILGRELVQIGAIIFSTIIACIFFRYFYIVAKKELDLQDYILPLLLFGTLFYLNAILNIEAILNSFFFFLGYYMLFHSEARYKEYISGLFLFLALISKVNVIVPIAFLLLWYSHKKEAWTWKEKVWKITTRKVKIIETLKSYVKISTPIVAGFVVCTILYKHFWIYSWHVFTNQTIEHGLIETLKAMTIVNIGTVDITYFLFIAVALIATYTFFKEKKFYALMSGPCFLILMFLIARAFGMQFVSGVRYWSVILPFVALTILHLKQKWITQPKKQLFYALLIIILIYPGMYESPLTRTDDLGYADRINFIDRATEIWQEKSELVQQLHYGYSIIPEQSGRILMEHDPASGKIMLQTIGSNIPIEKIDFLTKKYMASHPDVWGYPRYVELLGDDLIEDPTSEDQLNEKEKEVIQNIEEGTYSLIIMGPPEWAISTKIIQNVNQEILNQYCQILIPNNVWVTDGGWHFSYFFFKETTNCEKIMQDMYTYYAQNFEEICRKDKDAANSITATMREAGIPFNMVCQDGGDSLEFFTERKTMKIWQITIMLALFAFVLSLGIIRTQGKERKTLFIGIIICLIIIALGYFFGMASPPFAEQGIVLTG
jgi:hypothetical protein